jgi:hypothetical protein
MADAEPGRKPLVPSWECDQRGPDPRCEGRFFLLEAEKMGSPLFARELDCAASCLPL